MISVKNKACSNRKFNNDDCEEIKIHASLGAKMMLKIDGPYDVIISQHHERMNARGYPLGLSGNEINEYARIIGLTDTYEAMTHNRAFRKAIQQHQAIIEILGPQKVFFDQDILKAFIEKISIYPVGSFVRLNNGDVARVISSSPESAIRPVVLTIIDCAGKAVAEPKTIDLSKNDSFYIKETYSAADVNS
jgi:HD-GYP domain-containing protein (c-di-GMP phosphodiesterase class II)